MRALRSLLLAALVASICASARGGDHLALLVGVSDYPTLGPERQLRGPRNDVRMMRATLAAMHPEWRRIVTLADGVADADGLPTRNAISNALRQLARDARPGDFVVIYFSGHGSQQPAAHGAADEEDGFDEIFLPRDIGRWDGAAGAVRNALSDNDLNALITPLLAAGAQVWAVFDTCHAGTMTRGVTAGALNADAEVSRAVRPAELGVPMFSERNARAIAAATAGKPAWAEQLVVFSAAQSNESTPELKLPAGDPARVDHGLFSYTLSQALRLNAAATYGDLAQSIVTRYAILQRNAPTPMFEGSLQRELPLSVAAPPMSREVAIRIGAPRLCKGIDRAPCDHAAVSGDDSALRSRAARWLADANKARGAGFTIVQDMGDADIALLVHRGRVWFVATGDDFSLGARQPPSARDAATFSATLRAIVNVRRLFALADQPAANLDLSVAMYRNAAPGKRCAVLERTPLALDSTPQILRAGDAVCILVKNRSATSLDLSLLHVGADYAIEPLFPVRNESNRIAAGAERRIALEIVADEIPVLDRVVALAVSAQGEDIVDFSWLAQPGVATPTRGMQPVSSPLWMQMLRWISAPLP